MFGLLDSNYFNQMVTESVQHNDTLGLVTVTQSILINNFTVGEHCGSCDHKFVRVDIRTQTKVTEI